MKTPGGGITYEINRDHPLVDQIVAEYPAVKGKLETLLKNIERGIPLNQLYVDLNNDEKFENDQEVADAEMRITIEQMLAAMPSYMTLREIY